MNFNIFKDTDGNEIQRKEGEKVFWRISVYSLVVKEGKILCNIPTWHDIYELPGGGIEPTERIIDGVIRECYEETGYQINLKGTTPFYTSEENFYHLHEKRCYHSIILIYLADLKSDEQNKDIINTCDGDEIKEVLWLDINKFNKKNTHRIIYPAIELYKNSN